MEICEIPEARSPKPEACDNLLHSALSQGPQKLTTAVEGVFERGRSQGAGGRVD